MGLRLWKRPRTEATVALEHSGGRSARRALRDSLIVEVLNPKSALFYFAFLPQFTTPDAALPVFVQIIALGAVANISFNLTDVVCIVFARAMAVRSAESTRLSLVGRRVGGTILIGMGSKIIADAR